MKKSSDVSPIVSIVIPTFNAERFIQGAIESVLNQTFSSFEILIIDGGSNDGTHTRVLAFNDKRITFVSEPDHGIYDAMNKGIKLAQGKWLYFLGADDRLKDQYVFENIFNTKLADEIELIIGRALILPNNSLTPKPHFDFHRLAKNNLCHQAIFYKRSLFDKYRFDLNFKILADWDLNLKLFADLKLQNVLLTDIVVVNYNNTGLSSEYWRLDEYVHFFSNSKELSQKYLSIKQRFITPFYLSVKGAGKFIFRSVKTVLLD